MPIQAIIYDLDNTIFPVSAIGDKLFGPVFNLIAESGQHNDSLEAIKKAIMRTPFRIVAARNNFSDELTQKAIELQETLTFDEAIDTFDDYPEIHTIDAERFLVTTGFRNMQLSKINQLGIEHDFKEVHVVNPVESSKKEVFAGILERYDYKPTEVLVVGDDPESEIKAAKDLGIATVLYDKNNIADAREADHKIEHFKDLKTIIKSYR
ncbi:HAD hydrolase-like protein [Flavobacterium sp. Sd200]|uniref:HAD family hydrolase n=1 Tax=Flavobacterium sp. Sd200 TaxID=2692211 RepID=UPI001371749F|nr:HAD family hydrolase [Flavobacterium sp. Sd200]MXN91847.1 HAD hydrolase-like protein [Flavobacterium sp. Sd200]